VEGAETTGAWVRKKGTPKIVENVTNGDGKESVTRRRGHRAGATAAGGSTKPAAPAPVDRRFGARRGAGAAPAETGRSDNDTVRSAAGQHARPSNGM
jgi:hypothetical protein